MVIIAKKKPGPALSRSEVVTVRLDPKLRYLADLAARKQRRTVSSFIEWAIERGLDSVHLSSVNNAETVWGESDSLWDVDEVDRFVNLALRYPELLNHDEQVLWKLIKENSWFWRGNDVNGEWRYNISAQSIIFARVRDYWDVFKSAAAGDADARATLKNLHQAPTANKDKAPKKGKFDDVEDDVPF
jgi:hypothetical protein